MASLYLQRKELVYYMGVQNTCHMIREPKPLYGFSIDFLLKFVIVSGGGGGYFRNFWGGMCRWEPGTLNLYQSYLT